MLVMPFPSAVAAYSLDGGPLVNVQMPVNGTSYFNAVSNFEFIGQTFNGVGSHSLVITPLIPAAFFLDYIIVQSPTAFFPQKADVAVLPAITGSTPSYTPLAPTQSSTPSASSRAGLHPGAIAGIAVGIGACLVLLSVAWYLVHRRRPIRGEAAPTGYNKKKDPRAARPRRVRVRSPYTITPLDLC